MGVAPYLATLEAAGLDCGLPEREPGLTCVRSQDPGVDAIGVSIRPSEEGLVLAVYAYVVAPERSDFDDYATTFFREMVMPTLVERDELPSFETIRTAAQTSGRVVIGGLTFQFLESSTTRALDVTYTGP